MWVSLQARLIVKALAAVSKYIHNKYSGTKFKHRTEAHETQDSLGPEYKLETLEPKPSDMNFETDGVMVQILQSFVVQLNRTTKRLYTIDQLFMFINKNPVVNVSVEVEL